MQPARLPACIRSLSFPFLRDPDKALKPCTQTQGEVVDFWKLVLMCFVDGGHELWTQECACTVLLVDVWQRDGSSSALTVQSKGF